MSASITSSLSGDFDMSYDVDSLLDFDFDFSEISEDDVSLAISEGLYLFVNLSSPVSVQSNNFCTCPMNY